MWLQSPPGVVFVGGFTKTSNNTWGGQVQACRSLLQEAKVRTNAKWFLIDTTMRTLPPPSKLIRGWNAFWRLWAFTWILLTQQTHSVLIFTGMHPFGFSEKGVMCLIGCLLGKRVVLAPRSEVKKFRGIAWILNPFARWVVRACSAIICQSEQAVDRLRSEFGCPNSKLRHIPAWIDSGIYEAVANRRQTPMPGTQINFVYLGWFIIDKGVYELLTAFEALRKKSDRPLRLILCGDGDERRRMADYVDAHELGSAVDFRGWVDLEGKVRALEEAHIFVLPSYSEGLPNALLEAMASKLPCITTNVGGIPSVIENEVNGLLVAPKDSNALEAAMIRFVNDSEFSMKLANCGMNHIATHHQLSLAVEQIAELLQIPVRASGTAIA